MVLFATDITFGFSSASLLRVPVLLASEAPHGIRDVRSDLQTQVSNSQFIWGGYRVESQNPRIGGYGLSAPTYSNAVGI